MALAATLLPAAIGIALSPFGIIPAILLLFTPTPRAGASGFLAGWAGGVLLGFLLAAALSDRLPDREPAAWLGWLRIGLGLVLVGLGIRQWLRRHVPAPRPAWLTAIEAATPMAALRLGALLSFANPKVLLLAIAGGLAAAGSARLGPAAIGFAGVASAGVAAPLLLHVAAGDRVMAPLGRARDWLDRHTPAITAVILMAIGAALLVKA